jgi:hypothetical protein
VQLTDSAYHLSPVIFGITAVGANPTKVGDTAQECYGE